MIQRKNKTVVLAVVLLAAMLIMGSLYLVFRPTGQAGEKTISIEIVVENTSIASRTLQTREAYLGPALLAENLIEGERSTYGMYITAVNGIAADDGKQQWWCITQGGEEVLTGVDLTPIEDGDQFELTLMEGY